MATFKRFIKAIANYYQTKRYIFSNPLWIGDRTTPKTSSRSPEKTSNFSLM